MNSTLLNFGKAKNSDEEIGWEMVMCFERRSLLMTDVEMLKFKQLKFLVIERSGPGRSSQLKLEKMPALN